jgi:predicted anti-sigma-YlaC factor YlaD
MMRENGQPANEITCRDVAEWTSAYLDSHGGDDRNARIALHLAVCAGCAAYVEQIASVRNLIALLPEPPAPPAGADGLRRAFAARHGKRR